MNHLQTLLVNTSFLLELDFNLLSSFVTAQKKLACVGDKLDDSKVSVVNGMLVEVLIEAIKVLLFDITRQSVSCIISIDIILCDWNHQKLYHFIYLSHQEYLQTGWPFSLIILVLCLTASDYSRIIPAKLSTHYSLNYTGIIGTGLQLS